MTSAMIKNAGLAGKIYSFGELIYSQFFKKESDANKAYNAVYPVLRTTCGKSGRDSKEFTQLLEFLASLAPIGAKRNNFKRKYIDNKEGWRSLPKDPNNIPYGFWW